MCNWLLVGTSFLPKKGKKKKRKEIKVQIAIYFPRQLLILISLFNIDLEFQPAIKK